MEDSPPDPPPCAPVFGAIDPDRRYTPRRAAYALIRKADRVAVVRAIGAYFLPGGGCEGAETYEEALKRESREELGFDLVDLKLLGYAVQYFHAASDDVHFRMEAAFFTARLGARLDGVPEHKLEWVPFRDAEPLLFHACYAWAIHQAFGGTDRPA